MFKKPRNFIRRLIKKFFIFIKPEFLNLVANYGCESYEKMTCVAEIPNVFYSL